MTTSPPAVEPFRVAFIGIDHPHGAGWRELLRNFGADVAITAIMPGYGGAITSLEEQLAHVDRFDSTEALLAHGQFEGAVVCLPNDQAPAAVVQLARAGKHLLLEKPGAATAAAACEMATAIDTAGVAFQTGYMWRYDEAAVRLREMVSQGRFAQLINIEMTFVTSDVERRGPDHYLFDAQQSGGGFFSWLACHYLDLLFYVTGQAVVGVTARCGCYGSTPVPVEDGGAVIMELEGGALATFVGGYWLPRWAGESRWTVRGSGRWVHWLPDRPGTAGVLEIHGPKPQWHAMEETFVVPADDTPGYGGRRGVALVQQWIAAARQQTACRNSTHSMVATLELIDAIYESSRAGRRISCRIEPGPSGRVAGAEASP